MKKLKLGTAIVAIVVVAGTVFYACKKDGESILSQKEKKTNIDEPLISYTGNEFMFDFEYQNPHNHLGEKHNQLVNELFVKWNSFVAENEAEGGQEDELIVKLFAYAVPRSQEICGMKLEEYGVTEYKFVEAIINDVSTYAELNYMEMLEKHFGENHPDNYLDEFFDEFSTRFGLDADLTFLDPIEIRIIEQKIMHSNIGENAKNDYLIFCAVYRYSLENMQERYKQGEPLVTGVSGGVVYADAAGAVRGAFMGAKAGVAGGPGGVALTATIGAVCVGALSSGGEALLEEHVYPRLAAAADKVRSWFS